MNALGTRTMAELTEARDRHRARLDAIRNGAAATPDSAKAARHALARIEREIRRRANETAAGR